MGNVIAFKGIRYARAFRWQYPVEEPGWDRIYNVDDCLRDFKDFGPCAYQPRAFMDEGQDPKKAFHYREFREGVDFTYSEDCLRLNIYTSLDENGNLYGQDKPVIVYVHGGSYTTGSSNEKVFDPSLWVESGVVAVTINYRLGPFGFMCLPELASEAGHTGNYGLYDQLTALKWINHNIRVFGGDPDNVTLMGQSAGAMSATHLILSPLTKGLFAKAVLSSGGGLSTFLAPKNPDDHYNFWRKLMNDCNVSTIEEFRKLKPEEIYLPWMELSENTKNSMLIASPVIDNIIIQKTRTDDYKMGNYNHIPIMIGSNSEDLVVTIFYEMVRSFGKNVADYVAHHECDDNIRAYAYHFSRQLPGDNKGAWHSADLWYWFGTFDKSWREFTDVDKDLSKQMIRYLTNFAKTSNPNIDTKADGESIVVWESTSESTNRFMNFSDEGCVVSRVSTAKMVSSMLFRRK
ncbi:MAG: carboxylesterase family protein [Lachnospiraceae bacterium]|nr:carboxylesterase family protein [Lachnospiraceae bacterium]